MPSDCPMANRLGLAEDITAKEEVKKQVTELKVKEPVKEEKRVFKCDVCGLVCKSNLGLISHMRKHKKGE